ncbi:hypothetical protein PFISCL1PPCAC_24218, partial [Pristionchus fissidentatus]
MMRDRYDCTTQLLEVRNSVEVYDLFRDIVWYYNHPKKDQIVLRCAEHNLQCLLIVLLKKRINEQIKRQLDIELGYVTHVNEGSDTALMAKFLYDFSHRA